MTTYSQPGIINALDYLLKPNDPTAAVANGAALQAAINAAQASCATTGIYGGIVVIPSNDIVPGSGGVGDGGEYYFAPESGAKQIVSLTCPYPVLLLGTGSGTKLVVTESVDFFVVNNLDPNNPNANIGGVGLQDLQIAYQSGLTSGAAIRVTGKSQNVRVFRIVFTDCPVAVALDNALQTSIIDSVVQNGVNTGIAVSLGTSASGNQARETYIAGCVFLAGSGSGSTGGTGISIANADQVRVVNTRVEAFQQGIVIAPGPTGGSPLHLYFENVSADAYLPTAGVTGGAALLIQPTGATSVTQTTFVGCQFGPTSTLATKYNGAGVVLDQSQSSGVIDQVRFVSCYSCAWLGSGLQINGAVTNVEILGGYYSCNGASSSGIAGSGIEIGAAASGVATGVRIVGAACNNSVYFNGSYLPATQSYGVSIAAGAANVFARHCDLTGNNDGAILASSPGPTVEVTECAGYNDRGITLATSPPTKLQPFSATSEYGYCGPIAFYVANGVSVTIAIDDNPTGLAMGGFTLSPGETATLNWSQTSAPMFLAVGK